MEQLKVGNSIESPPFFIGVTIVRIDSLKVWYDVINF